MTFHLQHLSLIHIHKQWTFHTADLDGSLESEGNCTLTQPKFKIQCQILITKCPLHTLSCNSILLSFIYSLPFLSLLFSLPTLSEEKRNFSICLQRISLLPANFCTQTQPCNTFCIFKVILMSNAYSCTSYEYLLK